MIRRLLPFALVAPVLLAAGGARAGTPGWYFAGKGGPSYTALGGLKATQSGNTLTKTSSGNVVGAFGMAAGYEWMYRYHIPLTTELEFMNRTEVQYNVSPLMSSGTSGALASSAQNVTTLAKVYWHFPVGSDRWWPFVSGGLGWARTTIKSEYTPSGGSPVKTRATVDTPAWSVGAGATFKLGPRVMNDVELRYVDSGKMDWGMASGHDVQSRAVGGLASTEVVFSLRYMF